MTSSPLRNLASWLLFAVKLAVLLFAFAFFGGLLLLFVLIALPVMLVRAKLVERRRARQLAEQSCPHCGAEFGDAAARAARTRLQMQYREAWTELRAGRLRLPSAAPMLQLECPNCGEVTHFAPGSGLRVVDAERPAQPSRQALTEASRIWV